MDTPILPVIDIAPFVAGATERAAVMTSVAAALENVGFLYVRGLPLQPVMIEQAFATARRFFGGRAETKRRHALASMGANFGYRGLEVESLAAASPELKETFTMRNAPAMQGEVAWPDDEFQRQAVGFYEASLHAAHQMLAIMAACLDLPADFFTPLHHGENVTLRYMHYPANLTQPGSTQLGAGSHKDHGSVTLLFQDDIGGLEVRGLDGQWRSAAPMPGCALLNTGDLMERWTNGRFRSTPHRVLPVAGSRGRYSIALFVDPDNAVNVECIPSCATAEKPARYPPITAGKFIDEKTAANRKRR